MTSPDEPRPSHRRPRPLPATALCVGLLAAGVLAAWWIHASLYSRRAPPLLARLSGPETRPTTRRLEDLAVEPGELVGLSVLEGDPRGLAPPPGAVRRLAFQRDTPEGLQQIATYDSPAGPDDIAAHYARTLAGKGFAPLAARADQGQWRTLVYEKGRIRVIVRLRSRPRNASIVRIVVTCSRWRALHPPAATGKD